MKNFDDVQTDSGPKTLLDTHQKQIDYAKLVDKDSLYCLLPHPLGWIVEMVVDDIREADDWWDRQTRARVYYGQSGALRNAK